MCSLHPDDSCTAWLTLVNINPVPLPSPLKPTLDLMRSHRGRGRIQEMVSTCPALVRAVRATTYKPPPHGTRMTIGCTRPRGSSICVVLSHASIRRDSVHEAPGVRKEVPFYRRQGLDRHEGHGGGAVGPETILYGLQNFVAKYSQVIAWSSKMRHRPC